MYKSSNAYEGLEGVAADILINVGTSKSTDENLFVIKEKIRLQLSRMKTEILNSIPTARDRADLENRIKAINIDNGF